jgi:hypothetical protein
LLWLFSYFGKLELWSYFSKLSTILEWQAHHQVQLFPIEMESGKLFCLGWPGTVILQISASQAATRISGMSHQHLAPHLH